MGIRGGINYAQYIYDPPAICSIQARNVIMDID